MNKNEKMVIELRDKYEKIPKSYTKNTDLESVVDLYVNEIEGNLGVIADFLVKNKLEDKYVAYALGLTYSKLSLCKRLFEPLADALNGGKSFMALKAQLDLQKALKIKPASGKLVEMQLLRYDDEFKKKENSNEGNELPKLVFEIKDASVSEKKLQEVAPKIE